MKKLFILIALCMAMMLGWLSFRFHEAQETKNIFVSSFYTHYRAQVKHLLSNPHKNASTQMKALLEEIDKKPGTPQEQHLSHIFFVKQLREIAFLQNLTTEEQTVLEDLVKGLFLKIDLKPEMQSFLYQYVNAPNGDFLAYLPGALQTLHADSRFHGEQEPPYEDQFLQGNLPSWITTLNGQTQLFRIGQPICQTPNLIWGSSSQVSPEFLLFLQKQPRHFYVNLMKRKGAEGSLTTVLENLENQFENLYLITLDKNSAFYWQKDSEYPEELASAHFKQAFLNQLSDPKGNYFWSKHLNLSLWNEELQHIIHQVHASSFHNKESLNRQERQDFIEITYLAILDHLVENWEPASMNITCKSGIDRAPSLMGLWVLQKGLLNPEEITALLLAPPLIHHNRPSHASRIARFISAAKRFEPRK